MLRTETRSGICTLTLDRPDRLNALTAGLLDELSVKLSTAAHDDEIRCVIITGAGRAFCAGGDRKHNADQVARATEPALQDGVAPRSLEAEIDQIQKWTAALRLLRDMPKPTIAMINGACAGSGLSIAGACDLRFASRSAVFVSAFADAGVAGDLGGSWYWTRILGTAAVRELYLLSERLEASAAHRMGLVHRIFDDAELVAGTMAVASKLSSRPMKIHRYLKANLNAADSESISAAMSLEATGAMLSSGRWTSDVRRFPPLAADSGSGSSSAGGKSARGYGID